MDGEEDQSEEIVFGQQPEEEGGEEDESRQFPQKRRLHNEDEVIKVKSAE